MAQSRLAAVFTAFALVAAASPAGASVFTVKVVADVSDPSPGDGNCGPMPNGASCSLRAAIQEANASVGPHTIQFSVPNGDLTLHLSKALPPIKVAMLVDGTTQPGYAANGGKPLLQLDGGENFSPLAFGLQVKSENAANTIIRGLAIGGFQSITTEPGAGILLSDVSKVTVTQCFLGVRPAGNVGNGNETGLRILDGGKHKIIGNVISSNTTGVTILNSPLVTLKGNNIGLNFQQLDFLKNALFGISLRADFGKSADGAAIKQNLVYGSGFSGINLAGFIRDVLIEENQVLLNQTGLSFNGDVGRDGLVRHNTIRLNVADGMDLTDTSLLTIEDNVVSKNGGHGILVTRGGNNQFLSNFIGVDPLSAKDSNGKSGIRLKDTNANVIGKAAAGNEIAYNDDHNVAVVGTSLGNLIVGNAIHHSTFGNGVAVAGSATFTFLGGDPALAGTAAPNLIFQNFANGVLVTGNAQNTILSANSVEGNGLLGIDLQPDAETPGTVTPNDAGDADSGPNDLQNAPDLVRTANGIKAKLQSTPNKDYRIEFFASASCDDSGFGQGDVFLKSKDVHTDATGKAAIEVGLSLPQGKRVVSATASLGELRASGKVFPQATSEFSACVTVPPPG